VGALHARRALEVRDHRAHAACVACHSGGASHAILCENGECPVLYERARTREELAAVDETVAQWFDW
jgi:hypothetical protein